MYHQNKKSFEVKSELDESLPPIGHSLVADPRQNFAKCAEAGTCRQVEEMHGSDVDKTGDKISSFGLYGLPGAGTETSHVASCTAGNHRQFHCNGVGEIKRLDDVNRPGRPDSSLSNSPEPLTPIKTSESPTPGAGSSSEPHPPGTPPQRSPPAPRPRPRVSRQPHYMQPTVASSSREQEAALSKGKSRGTKRALARRNDLLEDILPYLDLILEV